MADRAPARLLSLVTCQLLFQDFLIDDVKTERRRSSPVRWYLPGDSQDPRRSSPA